MLRLQPSWSWRNTPEMERRGDLVRNLGPQILRRLVEDSESSFPLGLAVEGSDGAGRKARIPWIRVFSRTRSPKATSGWYLVYLFAADGSVAYLSLNQGTTDPAAGYRRRSLEYLKERVEWGREVVRRSGGLPANAVSEIELQDPDLGAAYEKGNVWALAYVSGALPDDAALGSGLLSMVACLAAVYSADDQFSGLPEGYLPGEALHRFSQPVAFARENVAAVPNEPGVHVVWNPEGDLLYVGSTTEQQDRLRTHLGGGRSASILHGKVGRMLDDQLGRESSGEEIRTFLNRCTIAWMLTTEPIALKRRIVEELRPLFSDVLPGESAPSPLVLAVYVGQRAEKNVHVGLEARTWGFPEQRADYARIRQGDWVVLGSGFTGGNARTPSENWRRFGLQRVIIGRVTQPFYEDREPLWPDEQVGKSYPCRFRFEVIDNLRNVSLGEDSPLGPAVIEAFRRSVSNGAGHVVPADGPVFRAQPEPAPETPDPVVLDLAQICREFAAALSDANMDFGKHHADVVRTFVVSLATKRLVLLTGLSGSGKTRIALGFGQWLGPGRLSVIPVRPDWTGPEFLFGYEDALLEARDGRRAWSIPAPLEFILRAVRDQKAPYLLLLDEMNLAHVERYFADLLSGMESDEAVIPNLRKEEDGLWRVAPGHPPVLPVPRNLFVVGTVNVDETTYLFSPKVLDRANTLEFRVASEDLRIDALRPAALTPGDQGLAAGFLAFAADDRFHATHPASNRDLLANHLRTLHAILSAHGFEFGHRVFYEALRFAALLEAAGEQGQWRALDLQVKQKVLPRMHGSVRRLQAPLSAVAKFCFDPASVVASPALDAPFDPEVPPATGEAALPESFDKARRMMASLRANQFASFSE